MKIQGWFPLGLTGLSSLKSKGSLKIEVQKEPATDQDVLERY